MQLASFGISIWVNNSFNLSKYTYVIMYDNNVCQLNVCDMGAGGRFFKYGGRRQGGARSFDVTGFASDSAEISPAPPIPTALYVIWEFILVKLQF